MIRIGGVFNPLLRELNETVYPALTDGSPDLVVQISVPALFDEVARVLAPRGCWDRVRPRTRPARELRGKRSRLGLDAGFPRERACRSSTPKYFEMDDHRS
jgi:hypothetical protein